MDPSVLTLLTSSLETVVNTALNYDPASQKKLAGISDILAIESTAPALSLYCHGSADGIRFMAHCESSVTTRLRGTPIALLALLKQPTSLANSGVELAGSVALLQQWQSVIQELDIDWEDAISTVLGDIAGPMLANKLRTGSSWVKDQQTQHTQLLKEYLPEELRVIPSKAELESFYQEVNSLKLDTDRLNARFDSLANKLKNHTKTKANIKEGNPE